jgi:hypothetical protein
VPPPRRADRANAFLIRVSFAGSAGLLIKQKSAAQGNIEEPHAARRSHKPGHRFSGTGLVPCFRSSLNIAAASDTNF